MINNIDFNKDIETITVSFENEEECNKFYNDKNKFKALLNLIAYSDFFKEDK